MKTDKLHLAWGRFAAMAGALLFLCSSGAHAASLAPATFETTGASVTATVLDDQSTVVTFLADGTIAIPDDVTARILLVGGGGGGGGDCAPGGGGGGVIDRSGVTLRAGVYSVAVGVGGTGGSGTGVKGTNGGNTSLARDGADEPLALAYGGGGAGAWNNGAGLDGGCGGGGWGNPGQGVEGQGYPATAQQGDSPGGGGGAGGSPVAVNIGRGNSTQRQADGGPGRASDITGTTEYYGPGGGSGGFDGLGGWGGDQSTLATEGWIWGCGWSHANNAMTDAAMVEAGLKQQGRDGYGGGGGGSSNTHYAGGNGGSGVLILRIDPVVPSPQPKISVTVETTGANPAIQVILTSVGADAETAAVSFQTALSAAGLDAAATNVAAAAATAGQTVSIPLSSYPAALTFHVRVVAKNDLGVFSAPVETTFRLPDLPVGAAAEGGDTVVQLSGASHDVVHTFSQSGTFTLSEATEVRYLVVGGGGAGGQTQSNNSGGGGGAGGFLTGTTNLAAGTYAITVGAGGQTLSADGSPSSIAGDGGFAITALGGGGGGKGNEAGRAGGSGGGGGSQNGRTNGGAGTAGQGFGGGDGGVGTNWVAGSYTEMTGGRVTNLDTMAGGGGGAGGPGECGTVDNHGNCNSTQYGGYQRDYHGGNGGPGLPSDITGEEVWYAGGGGGGVWHDETYVAFGGAGGKGGGGMGDWSLLPQADIDGKPNSGGGGGGQGRGGGRADPIYWGKGGSGIVVLRYAPAGDAVGLDPIETALGATSATVTAWTAGAGVAEEVRWGTDPADLSNTAAVSGGTATLSPLVPGTTYYAQAAGGGLSGKVVEFLARPWPSYLSDSVQPSTVGASDYLVTFTAGGAFTLTTPATVRALLVGGGGGGGCNAGGGGGAGGMLEVSDFVLEPGSYTVRIGAGGAASASSSATGAKGGDTVLLRDGQPVLRAYGGGGGQSWECYGEAALATSTGGSGGGNTRQDKPGTYIDPAQGNPGGPSINCQGHGDWDGQPGGGGGAGGRGLSMLRYPEDSNRHNGDGGPGRASDITGASVVYAAGGGASWGGNWGDSPAGSGGREGSGHGVRKGAAAKTGDENGLPNTGDGGGGGSTTIAGGSGGSGILVLRFARDPDAPGLSDAAVVENVLRLDGSVVCEDDGARVTYRIAGPGEDVFAATPVVLTESSTAGETLSFTETGLVGDALYTVLFEAVKDGHAALPLQFTATPFALDPAFTPSEPANDARSRVGADEVHVLSASGTFTLATARRVRLLAVGGGGGAGWGSQWGGGGGGAGGLIELPGIVLRAGTYRYEVGAGGAPGKSDTTKGGNGGSTVLFYIDPETQAETEVVRVAGGGGSGATTDGWRDGLDGGSGGGAVFWELNNSRWGKPGKGLAGQGHDGGGWTASPGGVVGSSGGGGAGAPGETGTATKGGDGGDGLPSDITGVEVWYAGGGGASARNNDANVRTVGKGGKGGGGHGADYGDYTPDPGRDGVDGLGGGGGGGLAWFIQGGPHRWFDCFGGRGGAGTLILRFVAAPTDAPVLAGVTATLKDAKTATFSGTVEWVGDGASTADVVLTAGGASETVATGLATGDAFSFDAPVTPGATFAWSLALRNDRGETSDSASGSIAVPADDPVAITTTGDPELRAVGTDTVAIFTNTAAGGSFTVPAGGAWVEMLVVGGGGAGGAYWDYFGGAGGGAGGFVHAPALFLEEGTYTVTVGAGGRGREDGAWNGNGGPGNRGSASFVQLGGVDVLRAYGGSGGASRYSGNCTNVGEVAAMGSTGGAMPMNTSNIGYLRMHAQPATPGQGHAGGWGDKGIVTNPSGSSEHHFAGGGGGAGAPGGDGCLVSGTVGDGGDGLPCSITGEEIWYAGGGGAGAAYKGNGSWIAEAGKGGKGGGGYGQRWQDATDPDNRGVNGLGGGGGGGGGSRGNQNNASDTPSGHAGGSGTVIVRWRSMPESTILVETEAPAGGFRRGTFAGTVTSAGGAGSTVDVEIGVAPAGSAATNWTTVATGLKAGDAFSAAIDGLADNRTYAAAWRASNAFASATGDAGSFATYAGAYLVPGAGAEGATVTQVGNDSIYTYSNPATAGTFTVSKPGYARVLVVGGGGAGGHYHGGGGGGGGVIEEDLVWLEAGTYDISVGAGGASSAWGVRGGNGGDSVVSLGGAERWRAYGGGGGGSWNDNENGLGGNGGSGGGSARRRETTAGNPIDPAQGHAGAPSRRRDLGNVDDRWSAGGGGGAGSPGIQASADHTVAGAGGAGRTSDISGSAQQYGAGGGASCTDLDANAAGEGGDGIGGHGRRNENTQYWVGDEPGRAGYGGGGGGGADRDWNSSFIRPGAPGGCGTVIIRFANAPAGKPDAAVVAAAPSATDPAGADVEILVRSLGNAASATLELAYGASQGSLPLRQAVGTVTAAGTVDALLSGLEPGKTYYVAAAIRTAAGETVTRAVPVTIPAAGAGAGEAGLWQTVWGAPLPAADADVWAQSLSSNVVAGAIASIGTGLSLDPFSGETYAWGGAPVCFLYKGAIFLKGGTTYTFGSQMDDTVRLAIGGTTLIDLEASPSTTTFADFTPPHTGWYPIEIRLGNATGDRAKHGPDGDGTTTWANFALAFNTEGSRSMIPEGAWTTLIDPGDGSLLRPELPAVRYADVAVGATAGGSLTLTASVAPGDIPVHAYLCYGPSWGGKDPATGWNSTVDLGEVEASAEASTLAQAQVPDWGITAKVAAVALVHPDGTVTWSAPVTYAGTSLLDLSAAATDWSQGDELEVSFTVAGGTGPYKATLYVGNGPGSLSKAATATLASAGTGTLRATGLTPSATYYWQVVVTDAAGGSAATDDSANVMMPGAAEILNTSSGISWSLDQRTVTMKGNLKTLGAGDNWALLYLTDRLYERWPNDTRAFRNSTTNSEIKVQLTQTGPFSITHTFDWNQEIGFNWVLSNSNGRVTWVGSRKPDWDGNNAAAQAHFWTGDYQTYTWNGGSGVWNDTTKWTGDGTMEGHEQAGYPVTGSYFMFPEGTHEVTIPAGGDKVESGVSMFRPTSFYLQKNAKVTLKATPESAALQLTQTDYPLRQHTIDIPEGAELVVSGVKGRWWTVRDNWSGFYFNGPNTLLEFTDGAEIDMGNQYGSWVINSWNDGSKVGRRFVVSDGAKLTLRGRIVISGPQVFTIDDGQVWMTDATWPDDNSITFAFTEGGRLVFRGAHPLLVANRRFYADTGNNPNGDALQFIDFEIPAAGFAEAPLRTRPGNTTYPFGDGGNANRRLVLRVPTNAPAATAKVVLDQPIVWWPAGTNACVLIDDAYLPHPDTDYWYETFDDLTGAFTGWGVHLVGRPASEAPQIVGLSLTNIVEGAAGFDFYGIPGDNAASATFSVAIARTDDPTDTTAAVSLVPAGGTVTAGTRFAVAATGLAEGGRYLVTVTGVDPSDSSKTCTETLEFDALRDYAEATASADAVVTQDGPYTVWTFTNAAAASTFTVTRPGTARILVVGGGGSGGGSDRSDENTGETRRGGGGGAGGEVLETELYLQAGEYPVVVGAGGAGTTVSEVGKQGGWSTFGYLATAYGGGGGGAWAYRNNTWNNYVDSGANGGGAGGQGAAGGAVTSASGHTGGVGTYNAWANWTDRYAGGGGGSTAGVGGDAGLDALNMFVAGDGADGVPSDITGSVVYYGGGGGGGCAGLRFGPGNGGRGGKGGGGEGRAWRNATAFATDAAQGADGFGGGGGGGSSCGVSGVDAALQAYRGGKGGSGVVIVRMLTATLEGADPVVSLKAAEPATGGLDLDFTVHSFGGDAPSADLFFAWGEGGALSHTNDLGTVSATGAVSRAVAGLKPGTAYAGQLVVDNGEGGRTAIPVSFRTAGESHADADSGLVTGAWTVSAWPENDTTFFSDNLLRASRGGSAMMTQNRRKSGSWGEAPGGANQGGNEADMIDGVMNRTNNRYIAFGTNNVVVFTLAEPSAVSSIRFFAGWGANDGWTPIAIEAIDVRSGANEEWTTLAGSAFQQAERTGAWGEFATIEAGGNDWLARDVRQIRVRFDKNLLGNHDGTMYWEIEAQGAAEADAPALHARTGRGRAISAGGAMRTATSLSAVASAPAGAPAFADVIAVWGSSYAGEDTNAWDHARSIGTMGEAASSLAHSVSGAEAEGAVYLRFCGVGADGTVSWSDSIYVPDLPVLTDVPPVVVFGSASSSGASADISATVVSAGSLAAEQKVDVVLQYTLDPDGFAEGVSFDTISFADDAPVGAIAPVAVSPLRAARRYYGRFIAENDAGQVSTNEVFTFDTAAGVSEDVAGGDWGLLQQVVTGLSDGSRFESIRATVWDEAQADAVEGTIMAYTTGSKTSTKNGKTYAWGGNAGFIYRGVIHLVGGVEYKFAGRIDDVVELKIADRTILGMEAYNSAAFGSWTPPATGWYDIDVRMSNGGGGAGYGFGLGWSDNGSTTFDANHMNPFTDPGDGSLLRTGAARILSIGRAEAGATGVSLRATLTEGRPSEGSLVAVWGAQDAGTDAVSDWAGSLTILANVDETEQTFDGSVALDPAATPVVRVVFVPAGGGDPLWSTPIVLDADSPTIGPVATVTDGDRLTVSGSMASLGTGADFELTLLWGYTEDFSDADSTNLTVAADGTFSKAVPAIPSTNGWWRLVARTSDGGVDATLPAAFETQGGSVLKQLATATVSHHDITASGTLEVLGAGTTTVTLWAGSDENSLAPVAGSSKVLAVPGPFSVTGTVPGDPHLVYWKIVSVNVAPGGTTWTSESPVYTITTEDAATYTWKAEKTEGDWDDPANWDVSGVTDANDVLGYPDNAKAKVRFVANTTAAIAVDRSFVFQDMSLKAAGLQVTFAGTNSAVCRLEGDIQNTDENNDWTDLSGVRIVVSGVELYDTRDHFNWSTRVSRDSTLRLENGAVLSMGTNNGWMHLFGTNTWVEAVGGSEIKWRSLGSDVSSGFDLCGFGGGLRLEDSTMNVPFFIPQRRITAVGEDQVVSIAGDSQLRVYAYFRTWNNNEDAMTNDVQVSYVVPVDGFAETPLYADYGGGADNRKFAWRDPSAVNGGRIVFSVDKDSPLLKSGRHRNGVQLMQWRAGIDVKSVRLEDRKGVHMYYTYGFPQIRTTPTSEGEIPTGVAADIRGLGGTLLLIH